jgi:hypothetical protein
MSVGKIVAAGGDVRLSDANSRVKNKKTGQIAKIRKEGSVFVLDFWIKVPGVPDAETSAEIDAKGGVDVEVDGNGLGFARQGR